MTAFKMRFTVLGLLLILFTCLGVHAQQDSSQQSPASTRLATGSGIQRSNQMSLLDSVAQATALRQQFVNDSLATMYIMPDPNRPNEFTRYIFEHVLYKGHTFLDIPYHPKKQFGEGQPRKSRDPWIIAVIIGLLLYTAFLNIVLGAEFKNMFRGILSKRTPQFDKDDRHIQVWVFICLFLLFGLTCGLFLYQFTVYKNVYYAISGFQLFLVLSAGVIILSGFKFLFLKFIGFIFDSGRVINEYITTLYLTYFNIAFAFLPVVVCFSLLAAQFIPYLLGAALLLGVMIFIWIYLRGSANIISNFRFHKFYLFIYLCALEICPILILIKVLDL